MATASTRTRPPKVRRCLHQFSQRRRCSQTVSGNTPQSVRAASTQTRLRERRAHPGHRQHRVVVGAKVRRELPLPDAHPPPAPPLRQRPPDPAPAKAGGRWPPGWSVRRSGRTPPPGPAHRPPRGRPAGRWATAAPGSPLPSRWRGRGKPAPAARPRPRSRSPPSSPPASPPGSVSTSEVPGSVSARPTQVARRPRTTSRSQGSRRTMRARACSGSEASSALAGGPALSRRARVDSVVATSPLRRAASSPPTSRPAAASAGSIRPRPGRPSSVTEAAPTPSSTSSARSTPAASGSQLAEAERPGHVGTSAARVAQQHRQRRHQRPPHHPGPQQGLGHQVDVEEVEEPREGPCQQRPPRRLGWPPSPTRGEGARRPRAAQRPRGDQPPAALEPAQERKEDQRASHLRTARGASGGPPTASTSSTASSAAPGALHATGRARCTSKLTEGVGPGARPSPRALEVGGRQQPLAPPTLPATVRLPASGSSTPASTAPIWRPLSKTLSRHHSQTEPTPGSATTVRSPSGRRCTGRRADASRPRHRQPVLVNHHQRVHP